MKKNKKEAMTLIELTVVVIIIGILASLILPKYTRARERSMDKQFQVMLTLIRAAERGYKMETGNYYPASGQTSVINYINGNLSLDLVNDGSWDSLYVNYTSGGFWAGITRNKGGYNRYWWINSTMTNASCSPNSGCP